jgi:hypothetical protein
MQASRTQNSLRVAAQILVYIVVKIYLRKNIFNGVFTSARAVGVTQ